jgi:microcystin-dependent protein
LRGKFILGASDARPAGTGGGAETVALTTAQMPSHSHGGATGADNAAHVHTYAGPEGQAGIDPGVLGWDAHLNNMYTATGRVAGQVTDSSGTAANHAHVIPGEGGGAAHENMPPYYALVYIMRVA